MPRPIDSATGLKEPPINFTLIAMQLGCPTTYLTDCKTRRRLILEAAGRLGFEIGGLDTMPSIDSQTQRPWRPRFDYLSLKHEERMLQAACYIVCAYLSGMRDSEVQAMRVGCYHRARSADGLIERHQIVSRVFKGFGLRGGQRSMGHHRARWSRHRHPRAAYRPRAHIAPFRCSLAEAWGARWWPPLTSVAHTFCIC